MGSNRNENKSSRRLRMTIWSILAIPYLLYNASKALASFSRENAFVGYSEGPIKFNQNPGIHSEVMMFSTHYGGIRVVLRGDAAPKTVEYMKSLAKGGLFSGCSFYRAEPPGETIDEGREERRRGYALVQGGLYSCGRQQSIALPIEPILRNDVGTVALITGTSEFFFNLEDHHEWDKSFTVWGMILDEESLGVLRKIVALPTYQEVHPSGTVMRILVKPEKFTVKLE